MTDILNSINDYYFLIIILSLALNIVIGILGVLPTIPLTTFNIAFFGPIQGFFVSLIGETLGAFVSFLLYRKGFKKGSQDFLAKHSKLSKLLNNKPWEQIKLVLSFRLFPYMPSGLITYAAAISNMKLKAFLIASTIGKVPAMVIEVILATGIVKAARVGGFTVVLIVLSIFLLGTIIMKMRANEK